MKPTDDGDPPSWVRVAPSETGRKRGEQVETSDIHIRIRREHVVCLIGIALVVVAVPHVFGLINRHLWAADGSGEYPIAKVIEQVRQELLAAEASRNATGGVPMFKVASFDLEIAFILKKGASGEAGADVGLIAVGNETEVSTDSVQRIKLHMTTLSSESFTTRSTPLESVDPNQPRIQVRRKKAIEHSIDSGRRKGNTS